MRSDGWSRIADDVRAMTGRELSLRVQQLENEDERGQVKASVRRDRTFDALEEACCDLATEDLELLARIAARVAPPD